MRHGTSYDISVDVQPWCSPSKGGFKLNKIDISESICGNLPTGKLVLESSGNKKSLELIQKGDTGKIYITVPSTGRTLEIPFFVTKLIQETNIVRLSIICLRSEKILTELVNYRYESDIKTIIKKLYPGKVDFRCEPDNSNNIVINQSNRSKFEILYNCLTSYKKNVIFGFAWDGLFIKDTIGINSKGDKEPDKSKIILGDTKYKEVGSRNFGLYGELNVYKRGNIYVPDNRYESESLWEKSKYKPIYVDSIRKSDRIINVSKEKDTYNNLVKNRLHNKDLVDYMYNSTLQLENVTDIPNYRIGDVIIYKTIDSYRGDHSLICPNKLYIVTENRLFLSLDNYEETLEGNKYSWRTRLVGVEKDGKITLNPKEFKKAYDIEDF